MLTKTCKISGKKFTITDSDLDFYKRMGVPAPELCPEERQRQRLQFRNERTLFRRQCDATGVNMISAFSEDVSMPVYEADYWWGDKWSGLDYGQDFDFNRPFFAQYAGLFQKVPVVSRYGIFLENSPFVNGCGHLKNSYFCFSTGYSEDCYYINNSIKLKDCFDIYSSTGSELCYECVGCDNSYRLFYSARCLNCQDSYLLQDCRRCKNCIGCCNLTDKEYHIWNQPVSKKEFRIAREKLRGPQFLKEAIEKFETFQLQHPKKYYSGYKNENFSGDSIIHAKDSHHLFCVDDVENVSYGGYLFKVNNARDYDMSGNNAEWIFNSLCCAKNVANLICCIYNWNGSHDNYYSHLISSSHDCFGCASLKNKKYCVFNKSYTKHEYEVLRDKIIAYMKETGEWGQFFPISMSPWAYNQTIAQTYFPLIKSEALKRGYKWAPAEDLNTKNTPGAQICTESGRPFVIQPYEKQFYDQQNLPYPTLHPDIRHTNRLKKVRPYQLWDRECSQCQVSLKTAFSPDSPDKILCENCYLNLVA